MFNYMQRLISFSFYFFINISFNFNNLGYHKSFYYKSNKVIVYIKYLLWRMKRERVFIDSGQTVEMKNKIGQRYARDIAPYELLVEAIELQNREIYELQRRYLELVEETKQAKLPDEYSESERQTLLAREQVKIMQRKRFVEEGLKANSTKYGQQFQRTKKSLNQVLENKREMLREIKGQEMNVFFNLQQCILDELIEFGYGDQAIDESKREEVVGEIKWWKGRYQMEMGELSQGKGNKVV